jgi:hypothetical protein
VELPLQLLHDVRQVEPVPSFVQLVVHFHPLKLQNKGHVPWSTLPVGCTQCERSNLRPHPSFIVRKLPRALACNTT